MTDLINLSIITEPNLWNIYEQMRLFMWTPSAFPTDSPDRLQSHPFLYKKFIKLLGYLVFLDSLQVRTIPQFQELIDCPFLTLALSEHASQEALHCQSYQYITQVYDKKTIEKIYTAVDIYQDIKIMAEFIKRPYETYRNDKTRENLVMAFFNDYLLEGVSFFNGFMPFYLNESVIPKTNTIISLIHRDENMHVKIFQNILKKELTKNPDLANQMLDHAYRYRDYEAKWLDSVFEGLNVDYHGHLDWRLSILLSSIGLEKREVNLKNPFHNLYIKANFDESGNRKTNIMEGKTSSYSVGGVNFDTINWEGN